MQFPRSHTDDPHTYVNPEKQLNIGLWTLFAGATVMLGLRVWTKISRRHSLWYDDYILLVSWVLLTANNSLISLEFATGYVADKWDDRMHILINTTSCGTLVGQALTKTAFGVTLLKLCKGWSRWILWFCIVSMNAYMVVKVIFQWGRVCGKSSYQVWYRLDFCMGSKSRDDFKEGGNVYNIIMDFIFAMFPWFITWNLDMRRAEKIGLCATMSLGMIIAIIAAVRTSWKYDTNSKDEWYFWRNAMSNIWYSSEITGTIMVQCVPVLRPLIRDIHTSIVSRRLDTTNQHEGFSQWSGGAQFDKSSNYSVGIWAQNDVEERGFRSTRSIRSRGNTIDLKEIPEEEARLNELERVATNEIGVAISVDVESVDRK